MNKGRIAGVALVAVAAVALVVGIITAVSSGGPERDTAGGGPPGSSSGSPGASGSTGPSGSAGSSGHAGPPGGGSSSASPSQGQSPTGSYPSGATTTVVPAPPNAGPGQGDGGQGDGGQGGDGVQPAAQFKSVPVRVYNNSRIKGLASQAADEMRADGYNVVQVDNYPGGIIPTTTMYYREGTGEKAAAQALAKQFHARAKPRFAGIKQSAPGVIAIVTKDFSGKS